MPSKFTLDLRAYVQKVRGDIDAVVKTSVSTVGDKIVDRSPVGDATHWQSPPPKGYVGGRFRANWQLALNEVPDGVFDDIDPSGQVSKDRIKAAIPDNAFGKYYYIANNLPYAKRIEEGWSQQAPIGIVAVTIIEWNEIVNDAVKGVKNG